MAEKAVYDKIARIISTIFVPPSIMLFIFFYFAFAFESSAEKKIAVVAAVILFGFILPVIMFVYFRKRGQIVDIDASLKEERTVPFLIAVFFYLCGLIFLILAGINFITLSCWFCYISNTLIIILINKNWKISAHALGVSGPLGAITYALGPQGLLFVVLLLIVGWSRLHLKVHTIAQIIAGGITGFALTYFQMLLLNHLFN